MLEKWKRTVNQEKVFRGLLTDLSTTFECLPHELKIAKLNVYRFNLAALKVTNDYLSERRQRFMINILTVRGKIYHLGFHKGLN